MALKDQPYMPLYVQDVLTDEKLIECSAESQGVYFRLLCILHKQSEYGCFLLKQKYKQSEQQILNFATALVRPLALNFDVIKRSLEELINEKVLFIQGDKLCQKRMIRDAEISEKRSKAGRSGGFSTAKKLKKNKEDFATAKSQANTLANSEYESEYENDNESKSFEKGKGKTFVKPTPEEIQIYCNERNNGISGQEFFDFYESKGWMVGKNKMKDWKASVRTWENSRKKQQNNATGKSNTDNKPTIGRMSQETLERNLQGWGDN